MEELSTYQEHQVGQDALAASQVQVVVRIFVRVQKDVIAKDFMIIDCSAIKG